MNVAALLLPFVVALPPGASAPPPGALPPAARVTTLDRELGLALVRLPRRGVAPALRRLRAATGVRYVERDQPLTLAGEGCAPVGRVASKPYPSWRSAIHLTTRSAAGVVIGMADSGIDDDRLAPRQPPLQRLMIGGKQSPHDPVGHGTAVASILVANRSDVGTVGIVPDATLLSARIVKSAAMQRGIARARSPGGVRLAAHAGRAGRQRLGESPLLARAGRVAAGAAAQGRAGRRRGRQRRRPAGRQFPASQPGVLAVGALDPGSSTQVWKGSSRGPFVDLVAPAAGIRVLATSAPDQSAGNETALTEEGTSFAAPLVTGAAAMLWATHRDWTAAEVANALVRSATPLGRGAPSPQLGLRQARREPGIAHAAAVRLARAERLGRGRTRASGRCAPAPRSSPASAGPATRSTPTRSTCRRAGRRAPSCAGVGRASRCASLPIRASAAQLAAVARMRPATSPVVVERGPLAAGRRPRSRAGAPTRSCSRGSPAAPAAERGPLRVSGRRPGLRVREPTTR